MGLMDQINAGAPPALAGGVPFAKGDDRARLWAMKTPFAVMTPPITRAKRTEFQQPNQDPNEWVLDIRLMEYRPDGSFGWQMQDDGEGGLAPVELRLTMSCNQTRNYQMQQIAAYVQANPSSGFGPIRLDKGQSQGKGAPPWIFVDWTLAAAPVQPVYQAPAAVVPVPPPPPAEVAPPPPPPSDDYQYQTFNGLPHRWRSGMATWEPVPQPPPPLSGARVVEGAAPPAGTTAPPQAPPGQSAQPLPATRLLQGFNSSEGMGAQQIAQQGADGSQMRQAVYQGEGRVMQPSGLETQNAAPEPEPTGASQTAATAPAGPALGVEANGAPAPSGAPQQGAVLPMPAQQPAPASNTAAGQARTNYNAGKPVAVTLHCPQCLRDFSTPAYRDLNSGEYRQTHICVKKPGGPGSIVLDAEAAVRAMVGV